MSTTLRYQSLQSSIHISFWQELSKRKLEIFRLSTEPVNIVGRVQVASDPRLQSTLEVSKDSFNPTEEHTSNEEKTTHAIQFNHEYAIPGKVYILNTLEEYKTCDKRQMLNDAAHKIWTTVQQNKLANPIDSCEFFILIHADLKKHKFLYWFCFPTLTIEGVGPVLSLNATNEAPQAPPATPPAPSTVATVINTALKHLENNTSHSSNSNRSAYYPVCVLEQDRIVTLSEHIKNNATTSTTPPSSLVYFDSCPLATAPGWTLRNVLTVLALEPSIQRDVTVHCLRLPSNRRRPYRVQTFHLRLPSINQSLPSSSGGGGGGVGGVGGGSSSNSTVLSTISGVGASWETDRKQRPRPRLADLSSSMDPRNLARVSVDLNVKLMRWRMLPELNTVLLQNTKCLLLGAGKN